MKWRWMVLTALLMVLALVVLAMPVGGLVGPGRLYLPLVLRNPAAPVMILIPAGTFQMGCDAGNPGEACREDELPLHTVYLDAFYINRTEVTNAQYEQCMAAGVCAPPRVSSSSAGAAAWVADAYPNRPVVLVDWNMATTYCEWLGKRLPTEAEWEKAARGGSGTRVFPWGNQAPDCWRANYNDCEGHPVAVGSYSSGASPYGVLDMAGNVSEWVSDWWGRFYYGASPGSNPTGPEHGVYKVLRGGHYHDVGDQVRVAYRLSGWFPVGASDLIGFRCAADGP